MAFDLQHPSLDTFHLLKGILEVDKDLVPFLFGKLNIPINKLEEEIQLILNKQSKVQGDQLKYPSNALSQVLLKCNGLLKEFGDEFVSLEHFLLALVSANDETANMLKKLGVTEAKHSYKRTPKRSNCEFFEC